MPWGLEIFILSYIYFILAKAQGSFLDCECGVASKGDSDVGQRIINGKRAQPHAYPWIVFLQHRGTPYCGGAIINDRYVLTAAHCVFLLMETNIEVVAGAQKIKGDGVTHKIEKYIVHERYVRHLHYDNNDLALIKVAKKFKFGETISPICLPEALSYTNVTAMISGWGRTEKNEMSQYLMYSFVKVLDDKVCKTSPKIGPKFIELQNLCAYGHATDTCQGDSGSALTFEKAPDKHILIGIVSWGEGCASKGIPGVYVRISSYLPWILAHTKDGNYCYYNE